MKSNVRTLVEIFKDTKKFATCNKTIFSWHWSRQDIAGLPAMGYFSFLSFERISLAAFLFFVQLNGHEVISYCKQWKKILENPKVGKPAEERLQVQHDRQVRQISLQGSTFWQLLLSKSHPRSDLLLPNYLSCCSAPLFPFSKSKFTASLSCSFRRVCSLIKQGLHF